MDRTPTSTTTPSLSGPGSNGNAGVFHIALELEPHVPCTYPRHSLRWGLTPLQRCSRCILQPQLTELLHIAIGSFEICIKKEKILF